MKTLKVSAIELSMKTKKGSCTEAIKELKNLFKRYGITMKGLLETEGLCAVLEDGEGNEVGRVDDASEAEKPNTFSMNAHLSIKTAHKDTCDAANELYRLLELVGIECIDSADDELYDEDGDPIRESDNEEDEPETDSAKKERDSLYEEFRIDFGLPGDEYDHRYNKMLSTLRKRGFQKPTHLLLKNIEWEHTENFNSIIRRVIIPLDRLLLDGEAWPSKKSLKKARATLKSRAEHLVSSCILCDMFNWDDSIVPANRRLIVKTSEALFLDGVALMSGMNRGYYTTENGDFWREGKEYNPGNEFIMRDKDVFEKHLRNLGMKD